MNQLKEMKWKSIFYGALYTLLGLVLLIFPDTTARSLAYAIGASAIVVGALTVLSYLLREVTKNYYRNDFVSGLTAIAVGILILRKTDFVISIVPFVLGVLVLFSGIMKLQHFIDVKRMRYGSGSAFLFLAVINIALGILLIIDPFGAVTVLFRVIGISMIFSGVTDIISVVYMSGRITDFIKQQEALTVEAKDVTEEA